MGTTSYDFSSRKLRATKSGYFDAPVNDVFKQNRERKIHESMEPSKALIRESRDSNEHPLSLPIIISLDVTGSMGKIPVEFIKDGLPTLMTKLMDGGIEDPQILFIAVGDTQFDRYPLQVGQFESGDVELDTWLTRTYIESGGGANEGESYLLSWYYAAKHTVTDSIEKRGHKGYLFTIGDEPSLTHVSSREIFEIMGISDQKSYDYTELYEMAKETYNVYHMHIMEGSAGRRSISFWETLMGEKCIQVDDYKNLASMIAETVINGESTGPVTLLDSDRPLDGPITMG